MTTEFDIKQLKAFSPLSGLKRNTLHEVFRKATLHQAKRGQILFKKGALEQRTIFVLSGTVELRKGGDVVETIAAGSDAARNPISPLLPREHTAVAAGVVEVVIIDTEILDSILTWGQTGCYEVDELRGEADKESGDWMTSLLRTEAFQKIPPANIQEIFMRLKQVNYSAGDTIIQEGDEGDQFYVIASGRCMVTRKEAREKKEIELAQLSVGDTFGEEALISGKKRNATVAMLTDGSLMCLGNDDFQTLLNGHSTAL
jgi:CRP-like cAMP-binding protein